MTLFEKNLAVQPSLTRQGEPLNELQDMMPDTIDLTHLAPDDVGAGEYEGYEDSRYALYEIKAHGRIPDIPKLLELKRIVVYDGGRLQVVSRYSYSTTSFDVQIMNWYPTHEERDRWCRSTIFITKNIAVPKWMVYNARVILRKNEGVFT